MSQAIDEYVKSIIEVEIPASIHIDKGKLFSCHKDFNAAKSHFDEAILFKPKNGRAFLRRGENYVNLNSFDKAISDFSEAIELLDDCQKAEGYAARGKCYLKMKDYDKAKDDFDIAIEQEPDNPSFYFERSILFFELNDNINAINDCNKAVKIDSDDATLYFIRFLIYLSKFNDQEKFLFDELNSIKKLLNQNKLIIEKSQLDFFGVIFEKAIINILNEDMFYLFEILIEVFIEVFHCIQRKKRTRSILFGSQVYSSLMSFILNIETNKEYTETLETLALRVFKYYPGFEYHDNLSDSLLSICKKDGREIFLVRSVMCTFREVYETFIKRFKDINGKKQNETFKNISIFFTPLYFSINDYLEKKHVDLLIKKEHEKAEARIDERNKVIQNLSHHIKNLLRTIIDPLENLKKEGVFKSYIIENALKGTNLIREIINAMNLSYSGNFKDFIYDVSNRDKDSLDLKNIILSALKHSIGQMFDGKYFSRFQLEYFPSRDLYLNAKSFWNNFNQIEYNELRDYIEKFFFDIDIFFENSPMMTIGNNKGSVIKLLILFQEIILNAVKYVSFVEREKRFLNIEFNSDNNYISFKVKNSFNPNVMVKTSGIGSEIIQNFTSLLNTEPIIEQFENIYSVEIKFANFWKRKKGNIYEENFVY